MRSLFTCRVDRLSKYVLRKAFNSQTSFSSVQETPV